VAPEKKLATLLVVDDEPHLLRLVTRVLERAHYRVLSAKNGDEALTVFDENASQIAGVILDVVIPPNGALEVMQALHARRPDLPVMLSSGDIPPDDLQVELDAHSGRFLRKPYSPTVLLREVTELFDSTSA
jgi:two-component system KDP operon response regulator KdpE/two-component system response regulator VicR